MFHRKPGQISHKGKNAQDKHEQRSYTTESLVNVKHPATLIQKAKLNPNSLNADEMLTLQETIGNRAVSRLLAGRNGQQVHQENKTGLVVVQREQKELLQKKSDIQYGTRKNDCGTLVDAYIDANDVPKGKSPPSSRPNWWNKFKGLSNEIKDFSEKYLVQGHLLNHHVGGLDNMDNLTPITGSANTTMLNFFEKTVKDSVTKGNDVLYKIEAEYHYDQPPTAEEIAGRSLSTSDKSILDNSGFLDHFCDWIYAEYTVYPPVGGKNNLSITKPIKESKGLWVKNESSEQKGTF